LSPFAILWPTFAMVALIFAVLLAVPVRRLRHVSANPPGRETFATAASARTYFEPVDAPANNLANLFETPVLFLALVPLLLITGQAGVAQVLLAWIFVAARATHSWIHVTHNRVPVRFRAFLVSVAVLSAMWIGFFVDCVLAARHAARVAGAFA